MNLVAPGTPGSVEVTVWDLEMTEAPVLEVAEREDLVLLRADEPAPELARFFYGEVGRDFNWRGRMDWTRQQWADEQALPTNHLWSCWRGGSPAGYFVLQEDSAAEPVDESRGSTELKYFGLLPRHHGLGIGRWLLTQAIAAAWDLPSTERFWLHTCSLDGPHAKSNYLARGFSECREHTEHQLLIDAPE